MLEVINQVENILHEMPQVDCPVVHRFGDGIYIREVTIPTGALAVGHTQKFTQNNFLLQGKIAMIMEDGVKTLEAPLFFVGEPGRKIGFVLETVVWQNIWATDETDIEVLEKTYMDKSPTSILKESEINAIEYALRDEDRIDYDLVIEASPFSHDEVKEQVNNLSDQIPMPEEWNFLVKRKSNIHGDGMFLTWPVEAGTVIGPARISNKRTPLGRYTNHSKTPNIYPELMDNGDIYFVANRDISGCKGGSNGEEITINYRETLKLAGIEI